MADIPGIIEGAAEGKGLGLRFLRHIERNSLLLFMVPGDTDDIRREYEILLDELRRFNPELLSKQRVLAVTKCDLLDEELMDMLREEIENGEGCLVNGEGRLVKGEGRIDFPQETNLPSPFTLHPSPSTLHPSPTPVVFISAVTGYHLDELKDVLWRELNAESNKLQTIEADDRLVHRDKDMSRFAQELIDEDADDEIEYLDADEIEDFDDFEYEEGDEE